jgi:uncharacterized protein DUF763
MWHPPHAEGQYTSGCTLTSWHHDSARLWFGTIWECALEQEPVTCHCTAGRPRPGCSRAYHWLSAAVRSYVNGPHAAVCAEAEAPTLNRVATESEGARTASAELSRQQPSVVLSALKETPALTMPRRHAVLIADVSPRYLQKILLKTYERAPEDFETLLGMPGPVRRGARARADEGVAFVLTSIITVAFGRRCIPADCVAPSSNMLQYSRSSRLVSGAPRRPRCSP